MNPVRVVAFCNLLGLATAGGIALALGGDPVMAVAGAAVLVTVADLLRGGPQ